MLHSASSCYESTFSTITVTHLIAFQINSYLFQLCNRFVAFFVRCVSGFRHSGNFCFLYLGWNEFGAGTRCSTGSHHLVRCLQAAGAHQVCSQEQHSTPCVWKQGRADQDFPPAPKCKVRIFERYYFFLKSSFTLYLLIAGKLGVSYQVGVSFLFWLLLGYCCSCPPKPMPQRPAWPSASPWRALDTCLKQPRNWNSRWWVCPSTFPAPAKTCKRPTPTRCQMLAVCLTWGYVNRLGF